MEGTPVGRVLGNEDSTPLEFWVAVEPGHVLQLDDVVACERTLPDGEIVQISGIVTQVRARHEGVKLDGDVFLVEDGQLPAEVVEAACVQTSRFEPEMYVPPVPGAVAVRAEGVTRDQALYVDTMERPLPVGLSRDGEIVMANLDFIDGTSGAHVNISGVSGVATKTSYATFLLHSLFTGGQLGPDAHNAKALIFNVKGEDLLWLDRPNRKMLAVDQEQYERLGLPAAAFASVGFWAPPRKDDPDGTPDVTRVDGAVQPFLWTLEELCKEELLPFLFADAEDDRAQFTIVIDTVTTRLRSDAIPAGDGAVKLPTSGVCRTFRELCEAISAELEADPDRWAGRSIGGGTIGAFIRRLYSAIPHISRVIRADLPGAADRPHRVTLTDNQVTVVDLHSLHDRAKRFVVGATIRRTFEDKERSGAARPHLFLVLDELNKYAPREGHSPIKAVLLDVAERGRSLGVILVGAQQTASEVERRVIANCAIRVVGRLDAAEAGRDDYGFLPGTQRQRATILKPGTMIISQPQVPVPIVIQFPFPAWATKGAEVDTVASPSSRGDEKLAKVLKLQR